MNDTELDETLNQWTVPPVPPSLRENLRAGFAASLPPTAPRGVLVHWRAVYVHGARKALMAAAIVGVGAFLFTLTQALSQTPPPAPIPYTVDSEFARYGDDGSRSVEMYSTSYTNQHGAEILVSRSIPGHTFETAVGRTLDAALPIWQRLILPFAVSSREMERYKKIRSSWPPTIGVISGCADWTCLVIEHYYHQRAEAGGGTSCLAGEVVGRETILNYPTAAVQVLLWDRRRTTLWMSPDLGCFALRITIEVRRPDGSFHLVNEKEALKVTLNH